MIQGNEVAWESSGWKCSSPRGSRACSMRHLPLRSGPPRGGPREEIATVWQEPTGRRRTGYARTVQPSSRVSNRVLSMGRFGAELCKHRPCGMIGRVRRAVKRLRCKSDGLAATTEAPVGQGQGIDVLDAAVDADARVSARESTSTLQTPPTAPGNPAPQTPVAEQAGEESAVAKVQSVEVRSSAVQMPAAGQTADELAPQTPVAVQAFERSAPAVQRRVTVRSVGVRTPAVQTQVALQAVEEEALRRPVERWSIGATAVILSLIHI